MFDFAISRNKRRRPTRRIFASWVASCFFHLAIILLLIRYPQALQGGRYHNFRSIPLIESILGPESKDTDQDWRTVAVLKSPPMSAPSAATLKKYLYDWGKKGEGGPPIRVRWGDVKAALGDMPPMPRVQEKAKAPNLSLPANELVDAGPAVAPNAPDAAPGSSPSSAAIPAEPGVGKKGTMTLPSSESGAKTDVAGNSPPKRIPDSILPSNTPPASGGSVKVFENEQKAIHSPESGFFDTQGFPLGEYVKIIKERLEGRWLIPSNLRNSQGRTTIVFYIDKDGRFMNARIVNSSGSNSLDLTALNAVIESNPFPPLPKGFPGDHIGAKFVFSYNEPQ